jgi:tetratricopeptide (TPR) repeat protein
MTRNALGWALRQRGLLCEAERTLHEAVSLGRSAECRPGLEHATSLNNLAKVMLDQRRFEEALPLFRDALTAYQASQYIDLVTIATLLNNIGDCLVATGNLQEAESSILGSLSQRAEQLGERHPYVAISHTSLARLHLANGRYSDAIHHSNLAIDILTSSSCGTDHIRTAQAIQVKAEAMRCMGDTDTSSALFREVLRIRSEFLPRDHPDLNQTLSYLMNVNNGETTNEH